MITNNVVTSHSVLAGNETQRNGNVEFDNIPEELKDLTIWYVWGWQERSGKRTKPPLDVNRQCEYFGRTSGEGHEKTLTSYYAAVEFLKQHHGKTLKVWSGWDRKQKRYRGRVDVEVGGIGFKLIGDYCGLDLDKCVSNGCLSQNAAQIVASISSYSEISPSGTGVRILCKGKLPKGGNRNDRFGVELYDRCSPRFVTLTGHRIPATPNQIEPRQEELETLHADLFGAPKEQARQRHRKTNRELSSDVSVGGAPFSSLDEAEMAEFESLLSECDNTADRSQADFKLLCWCKDHGLDSDDVWERVQDHSKFAERSRESYFDRTWDKARASTAGLEERLMKERRERRGTLHASNEEDASANGNVISSVTPRKTAKLLLKEKYRDRLVYHCSDIWHQWDGRVYREVHEQEIQSEVSEFLDTCLEWNSKTEKNVPFATTPSREKNVIQELKNLVTLSSSMQAPTWFDNSGPDPANLVSFQNGHLNVATGELLPHSSRYYTLHCLPHNYRPNEECPGWLHFLDQVFEGDKQCIGFLQQWFGYCLTPDTSLEKFLLLKGPPRAGKGTITTVLGEMLGSYNVATPRLRKLGREFGLFGLLGKLLALVPDAHLPRGDNSEILETLKAITGNDNVDLERKHKQSIDNVKLSTRIVISTNELPRFVDNTGAIADRAIILPFFVSFRGREDSGLKARLRSEVSGITNWALEGLKMLRSENVFWIPDACKEQDEVFRHSLSTISGFVDVCCELGTDKSVVIDDVFEVYRNWCTSEGHFPVAKNQLLPKLQEVDPRIGSCRPRLEDGSRPRQYRGIALTSEQINKLEASRKGHYPLR